jgi:hypothetical protein
MLNEVKHPGPECERFVRNDMLRLRAQKDTPARSGT